MKKTSNRKIGNFLLIATFFVFNVGLPVVVASCPMTKARGSAMACCSNKNDNVTAGIGMAQRHDCCKTTIAAERNTTEFLQIKSSAPDLQYSSTPLLQLSFAPQPDFAVLLTFLYSPPPCREDIPIFTSSLLI